MRFPLTSINCSEAPPSFRPLPNTVLLSELLNDLITVRSTVVGSWEESPNIWITQCSEKPICWLSFEFARCWKAQQVIYQDHKIILLSKTECASNGQLKPLGRLPIMRVVFVMILICILTNIQGLWAWKMFHLLWCLWGCRAEAWEKLSRK